MTKSEIARLESLQKENTQFYEDNLEMKKAIKEFIYRVEAGEVRSTYTYNQFKEVLKKIK